MEDGGMTATNAKGTLRRAGLPPRCLVVIPCLNEARHIAGLIDRLTPSAERLDMRIVVADGGSTDGTMEIVSAISAANDRVVPMHNVKRVQSAALNLAVAEHGSDCDYVIRVDAHGDYPGDYCDRLVEEAVEREADSVVVSMMTRGHGLFQRAAALAQNSKLGNGGAQHRQGAAGHWTDHGHHALMAIAAFRAVGGYDESFSHNEDAELDHRLRAAGFRIWMTDRTAMTYYPRSTAAGLFRQYLGYGRGRARNVLKHRTVPRLRQAVPLMVFPVIAGTGLAFLSAAALLPAALWVSACLGYGALMAFGRREPLGLLAPFPAMIMHLAWSAGFWFQLIASRGRAGAAPTAVTEPVQ
jgi:succinoglycan biosynthesis protein ExoA